MAYQPRNFSQNSYNGGRSSMAQPTVAAKDFPEEYVDFAEKYMQEHVRQITTSKLRNLLSLLMDVYNTEILRTEAQMLPESATKLQMARIRIAYECGRDANTKNLWRGLTYCPG